MIVISVLILSAHQFMTTVPINVQLFLLITMPLNVGAVLLKSQSYVANASKQIYKTKFMVSSLTFAFVEIIY